MSFLPLASGLLSSISLVSSTLTESFRVLLVPEQLLMSFFNENYFYKFISDMGEVAIYGSRAGLRIFGSRPENRGVPKQTTLTVKIECVGVDLELRLKKTIC